MNKFRNTPNTFFFVYGITRKGPMNPPARLYDKPGSQTTLLLEKYFRNEPSLSYSNGKTPDEPEKRLHHNDRI